MPNENPEDTFTSNILKVENQLFLYIHFCLEKLENLESLKIYPELY